MTVPDRPGVWKRHWREGNVERWRLYLVAFIGGRLKAIKLQNPKMDENNTHARGWQPLSDWDGWDGHWEHTRNLSLGQSGRKSL